VGSENTRDVDANGRDSGGNLDPRTFDGGPVPPGGTPENQSEAARPGRARKRASNVDGDNLPPQAPPNLIDHLFSQGAEKRIAPPDDPTFERNCPALWQLLTIDRYSDGRDRFLADIVIRRTGGGYVAELRDHETNQKKAVTALRAADVLPALEHAVCDATVPWRAFKSYDNPQGLDRHSKKKT